MQKTMIKTWSVQSMSFLLSLFMLVNVAVWSVYAIIGRINIYILVSPHFSTLVCILSNEFIHHTNIAILNTNVHFTTWLDSSFLTLVFDPDSKWPWFCWCNRPNNSILLVQECYPKRWRWWKGKQTWTLLGWKSPSLLGLDHSRKSSYLFFKWWK